VRPVTVIDLELVNEPALCQGPGVPPVPSAADRTSYDLALAILFTFTRSCVVWPLSTLAMTGLVKGDCARRPGGPGTRWTAGWGDRHRSLPEHRRRACVIA